MCKYCEPGSNSENLMCDDLDFGVFGEGVVLTNICGTPTGKKELQTYIEFGECNVYADLTTRIYYCPICGRKFREAE